MSKRKAIMSSKRPAKRRRTNNRKRLNRRQKAVKTFPVKQLVELTYCETVVVPSKDAGTAPYKFRLNSLFDPNETATGHQPRGHDQWSAIYKKYCVIGAKVLVEPLLTPSNTDVSATLFGYVDDDNTSDQYTVETLRELNMPHSTHKFVELGESHRGIRSYKSPNLKFNIGMKKFFGVAKKSQIMTPAGIGHGDLSPLADPYGMSSGTQSSPVNKCNLKLHTQTNYSGGDAQTITCRVTIKYLAVYHDPMEVASS